MKYTGRKLQSGDTMSWEAIDASGEKKRRLTWIEAMQLASAQRIAVSIAIAMRLRPTALQSHPTVCTSLEVAGG